jgi:apolipoprotein N-acyltransferase
VGLSNNSWFARSVAIDWQERLSAMRAIELRTDVVRAVNRGVTTWVDASGRTRLRHVSDDPTVQVATPRLRPEDAGTTLYVRAGDGPLWAALAVITLAAALRRRRGDGVGRAT